MILILNTISDVGYDGLVTEVLYSRSLAFGALERCATMKLLEMPSFRRAIVEEGHAAFLPAR